MAQTEGGEGNGGCPGEGEAERWLDSQRWAILQKVLKASHRTGGQLGLYRCAPFDGKLPLAYIASIRLAGLYLPFAMRNRFSPRLHVISAAKKAVSVIFRRGPSFSTCTILWDREKEKFALGQRLHGRIYSRRSDLSPDGKYMIYFAMNGRWHGQAKGAWTAVSKAPYLKALALYAKGDCWNGGGLFTGPRTYWLNDGRGHEQLQSTSLVSRDREYSPEAPIGGECPGIYYPRLQRDGWTLAATESDGDTSDAGIFEKELPKGWILRKIAHGQINAPPGKGCYWDEHELTHAQSGQVLKKPDWEWADFLDGRVAWCKAGKLYQARLDSKSGLREERCLRDFNEMEFEPIAAPY